MPRPCPDALRPAATARRHPLPLLAASLVLLLLLPVAAWAHSEAPRAGVLTDVPLGHVVDPTSGLVCDLVGGLPRCVHRDEPGPGPGHAAAGRRGSAEAVVPVGCAGDGQAGNRIQVVYTHQSDRPDRLGSVLPELRRHVDAANAVFHRSSDGSRQLRAVTDGQCQVTVDRVTLSPVQAASFTETIKALRATGRDRVDRKYLVFMDNDRGCGLAEYYRDDRAVAVNRNNQGDTFAIVYAPCWGGVLAAHELVHMLGGVQASAPRSTGSYGHCTDGHDVMCYADGSGRTMSVRCAADHAALLDCGRDDYFSVEPQPGSYLATHWNTAVSSFLVGGGPSTPLPPSPPMNVSTSQESDRVHLRWDAPETAGSGVETFQVVDLAKSAEILTSLSGDARAATLTLTPWRTYRLAVVAGNSAGDSPAAGDAEHMVGRPPSAPTRVSALYTAEALDVRVRLMWTAAEHATAYTVYRDGSPAGRSTTTSWTETTALEPGRSYAYTVQASNAWGTSPESASASALAVWPATREDGQTTTAEPVARPRATGDSCPPDTIRAAGFTDVPSSSPHKGSIDCVAQWQVAKGTAADRFSPEQVVSRAQMASFVGRMITQAGGELPVGTRDHFDDDDGSPHEPWVNSLAEVGIADGTSAGTYEPGGAVTRAQMAKLLTRAYEYRGTQHDRQAAPQAAARRLPDGDDYFSDDDGLVLEPDINKAAAAGFTGGFGDGTYRPAQGVRRDHMASFLARVLDLVVEDGMAEVPQREDVS